MNTIKNQSFHGLGDTQRDVIELLKQRGNLTLGEIASVIDLSLGTLRQHLNALGSRGLVERSGTRRTGSGRPEVVYALSVEADALFPHREGELLADLIGYLTREHGGALEQFFANRVATRREAALARVGSTTGRERTEEVARILSDEGFLAEVTTSTRDGRPGLKLCHCPLKEAVAVTRLPCGAELALVTELLGEPLTRTAYMPDGDLTCSYEIA